MSGERLPLGRCPCGGNLYQKNPGWAACDTCMDDTFPLCDYEAGEVVPDEHKKKVISRFEEDGNHLTVVRHDSGDVDVVVGPRGIRQGQQLMYPPLLVGGEIGFRVSKKQSPRTWRALHDLFAAMELDHEYDKRRDPTG